VGSRTAKPEGIYFVTASQSAEAERLASHVAALALKRVVIVHSSDAVGEAALVALEEGLYGVNTPPTASLAVSPSGGGAQAAAAAIREAQPQAVLLATTGRATTEVLRALADNSTGLLQVYGLSSSAGVGDLGRTGIGYSMVQVLPSPKNSRLPIAATFRQALTKGEGEPGYVEMEGCLAVLAVGEALKRKGDTSRAAVWRSLKEAGTINVGGVSINFSDPVQGARFTDIVYFGPDGRMVR
jgi:ABC-type branched-subunit amino acid transport system substrate-binding protein